MIATNGVGYEIQAYDNRMGWRRASVVVATAEIAEAMLVAIAPDGVSRRVYESLSSDVPVQVLPYMGKPQKLLDEERAAREVKAPWAVGTGCVIKHPNIKEDWQE